MRADNEIIGTQREHETERPGILHQPGYMGGSKVREFLQIGEKV